MKTHQFESKSSPGVVYTTVVAGDGMAVCNCPGFIYSKTRSCTHTKRLGAVPPPAPEQGTLFVEPSGFVTPMLASPLPEGSSLDDYCGPEWVMEEKYDGHRLIVKVDQQASTVTAWSRQGNVRRLPLSLEEALKSLPDVVIDGELMIPGGTATDVAALDKLQNAVYVAFDLLMIDGQSAMDCAAHERRTLLETACQDAVCGVFKVAPQFVPSLAALQSIWRQGGEGAMVKHQMAKYLPGKRIKHWVKFKRFESAETVVTGFEAGLLGPCSIIVARHVVDGVVVKVKSLNDQWRADFERDPASFIGSILFIEHQGRTRDGKFKSPMADHLGPEPNDAQG